MPKNVPASGELWTNGINTCRVVTVAYEMPSMWEIVVYDYESGEPPYYTDLDNFVEKFKPLPLDKVTI